MTLEKLLIFGFALAALFAITTVGVTMVDDRETEITDTEGKLDDLRNSAN